ncbi:MAG: ATP-binding cassette domain-containing protein [Firmicutes bacterium]|nr:ATP-binding cassette domain-containing protein [Alicyclobacillaceae bacterium]MCL6497082.1 ATP-binding cassette domain-containing protein [Bacillota bacterium]
MGDRIVVEQLTKRFGEIEAVRGVSFTVGAREVFGFLGPNGAGKTTTIKMLATLLEPTSGRLQIEGLDVVRQRQEVRRIIGLVFQDPTLDDRLTAWENLLFHGMLYGLSQAEIRRRAEPLLEMVGLAERQNSLVRTFSGGMKRRLELVRGLIHTPKVLFLDEPTVGLDPQTRSQLWQHIRELSRHHDTTVFVTTHYMDEAEHCDRTAIMDHGQIVALDTPEHLKQVIGSEEIRLTVRASALSERSRWEAELGQSFSGAGTELLFKTRNAGADVARIVQAVGPAIERIEIKRPTLEDVFLHLTGREIREETVSARDAWREFGRRRMGR